MQLKRFTVTGLFGRLQHTIEFPLPKEEGSGPSVVIIYGRNGIGKTTILRMLDGLLRLDFDIFRQIPFESCVVDFDSNERLQVIARRGEALIGLEVSYRGTTGILSPRESGALGVEEKPNIETIRHAFFRDTETIVYEFIDTERLRLQRVDDEATEEDLTLTRAQLLRYTGRIARPNPKARFLEVPQSLAVRVSRFIKEAQINYRAFFSTTEPDLFPRIIARLTSDQQPVYEISDLRERFEKVHRRDKLDGRLGLEPDRWDYDQMLKLLEELSHRSAAGIQQALTVLGSYVEQLESRSAERTLVADRLRTFERLIREFWQDNRVSIDPRRGFEIHSASGELLRETQLSSGEFHLLLLMVAALVTKRKGTIIAIDEPEMSMHIGWQSKLVPALVECASKANPLFIFATHSPDLAASLPQAMVELK